MIDYSTLIQTVGARANAADSNEARQAVEAVVTVVALALDDDERGRLADVLPGALRSAAALPGPATPVASSAALVRTVSERSGCPAERARFYTQAVLATVADAEPEVAELIARRLPDGHELFSPIDQGVTARGSGVPTRQRPRSLDRDEIARQLDGLTGWEGDELRLRRTVVLPPDRVRPLRDAVGRVERELDHHARVTQDQGAVTFEVWTHSLDRVTDMDVELARRINRAVEEIGASG